MFMVIPTWLVTVEQLKDSWDKPIRVPESNLDAVLHVLTFNKLEFSVRREREEVELDVEP